MGNEYRCYFWPFRRENLTSDSKTFTAAEIVSWVQSRRRGAAKEVIEHLLKRTANYACRDDNKPQSRFPDDDIFVIQNIGSVDSHLLTIAGRAAFVSRLEKSDSVLFRRYLRSVDPLPANRKRPPTTHEIEELQKKYVWQVNEDGGGFPYEENLEHYIVKVLGSVEEGLELYQSGRWDGIRCSTDVGEIDLLCIDKKGNFVVIELKRDQTPDQAIGQLARYIGWVEENYPDREVRGIIICKKTSNRLRLAARALRATVVEYGVSGVDVAGQVILRLRRM